MKHFSIYDLPHGKDSAEFPYGGVPGGFADLGVKFYARGETSDTRSVANRQEMLVIMQGRADIAVNGVTNKTQAGDVVLLESGDVYKVTADDVDPAVVYSVASSGGAPKMHTPQRARYTSGLETSIMGPD